jgi:hypothetical protein
MIELRKLIEEIIYDALDYDDEDVTLSDYLSEVIVRELGLRLEWGALDDEDSGVLADSREELKAWGNEKIKYRYITDWKPE